jgi:hypothetical protein
MKVAEAFDYLVQEEEGRLVDMDQVTKLAVERVEDSGIVFLDEIDKIAGREGGHGPDVSREGVQRDILPIVEGTTVNTKYGMVSTDHILFIAAGAFHVSKPSDLIPELQGRFPIRVELQSLTVNDFVRILTEPKSSLVKQSTALLETEGLKLEFTPEALAAAYDHGTGAGRDQLPGAGPDEERADGGFAGGCGGRGFGVGSAGRAERECECTVAGDRAAQGRWDDGEGGGGRSGVCAAAGGGDCEESGFEPVYFVVCAATGETSTRIKRIFHG